MNKLYNKMHWLASLVMILLKGAFLCEKYKNKISQVVSKWDIKD